MSSSFKLDTQHATPADATASETVAPCSTLGAPHDALGCCRQCVDWQGDDASGFPWLVAGRLPLRRCERCDEFRPKEAWGLGEMCAECVLRRLQIAAYFKRQENRAKWLRKRQRGKVIGPRRWIDELALAGPEGAGPEPIPFIVSSPFSPPRARA